MADVPPGPEPDAPAVRRLVVGIGARGAMRSVPDATGAARLSRQGEGAIVTGRLPTVLAPADEGGPEDPPAAMAPALERNAVPFSATPGAPLLAIVLVPAATDGGGLVPADGRLDGLDLPLTVALPPGLPRAADVAARHRAAGREGALLGAGLPDAPRPRDVEVSLAASLAALPEAVALVEAEPRSLSGDAALAAQVTQILAASGHGLVLRDRGLGASTRAPGPVPRAVAVVVHPTPGTTPDRIARVLDRAAFEARRSGAAVALVAAGPEGLAALSAWSDGARSVTLAPLSAVLRRLRPAPGTP